MNPTLLAFNLNLRPEWQGREVRFGNQPRRRKPPDEQSQLRRAADQFRRAYHLAEAMPADDGNVDGPLEAFLAEVIGTDGGMLEKMARILKRLQEPLLQDRSLTFERDPDSHMIRKVLVKAGGHVIPFEHRRNIYAAETMPFEEYIHKELDPETRVVIAVTGWTKPPVEFLLQDAILRRRLEALPREKWPAFAERFYVEKIKDFLDDALGIAKKELEAEGQEFNPATDVGFLYGVTPEGVDRAVEEFCRQKGIKCAGITAYDWAGHIPDAAGRPPVYLAKDPATFGTLMSDASNKIVVVGGRSYAANMTMDGRNVGRPYHKVPIDLMAAHGIDVPGVVQDHDNRTAVVINAAKVLKTEPGGNPEEWDFVRGAQNIYNVPREVFIFSQVIKQALRGLYATRGISVDDL